MPIQKKLGGIKGDDLTKGPVLAEGLGNFKAPSTE